LFRVQNWNQARSRPCKCSHDRLQHRGAYDRCLACACAKFSGVSPHTNAKRIAGFGSGFERDYSCELDLRIKAGDVIRYDKQVVIPLDFVVDGRTWRIATYKIDFVVECADGYTEYVETKGREFPEWKLKWKMFEALYSHKPMVRLLVVKQRGF
jgi:hypothetical protein